MQYQQPNPYQGQPGMPPQQQPPQGYPQPGPQQPQYQQAGYQQPGVQPGYAPPQQPVYGAAYGSPFPTAGGVKIPIMISGICNALNLLLTPFYLMTIFLAWVPLLSLILMIFEFKMVASLNGRVPPSTKRGGAQAIAICEILSILYGNVASAICGIIALCNLGKMQP